MSCFSHAHLATISLSSRVCENRYVIVKRGTIKKRGNSFDDVIVAQGNFSPDTAPRVVKKTETIARKKVYAPVVGADGSVITPASDNEEVKKTETTIEVPHPTAKSTQPTSAVVLSAFVAKHVPIDATSGATQKYIAAVPTTFGVHSAKVDGEVTPVHDAHEAADMGAAMRTVAFGVDKGGASRMVRTKFKHADSEYWRTFSGRAEEYSKQYIAATQDSALPRGVVAVADGTGLGGNPYRKTPVDYLMEEQLRFHVRIQDLSLLVLFLLAYFCVIAYGFVIVYRSSRFLTSAKYFDDKFVHHCRNSERDNFLDCFNRPLQKVQLHIIGYRPGFSGGFMHTLWRRRQYQVAFHTALDIGEYVTDTLGDITAVDMLTMDEFLQERSETLNTLVIKKCTNWDQWEQLAVNIKSAICRAGFEGVVDVNFQASEDVVVHQNNQWSNFLKHHTTKTLFFLSIFGVLWYYPYLAFKKKKYVIESHFKVEKSSAEFWDIVRSALCKDGFDPRIRFN